MLLIIIIIDDAKVRSLTGTMNEWCRLKRDRSCAICKDKDRNHYSNSRSFFILQLFIIIIIKCHYQDGMRILL